MNNPSLFKKVSQSLSPAKAALLQRWKQGRGTGLDGERRIERRKESKEIPLSFAQERIWFLQQWQPSSTGYNLPTAMELAGRLDVVALEKAIDEVIRRHESLRTTFTSRDGRPVQVVHPHTAFKLQTVDLQSVEASRQAVLAKESFVREGSTVFDLSKGPLFRVLILRLAPERHILIYVLHHIISDGWSMGILFSELVHFYLAFAKGRTEALPELAIQYPDFAQWQRERFQEKQLQAQVAYWKEKLRGAPPVLDVPTDRPRPAVPKNPGGGLQIQVDAAIMRQLASFNRQEEVTSFVTLLAAFQVLLFRYTGQKDIVVGTPIANRHNRQIENVIGLFVNTLALRTVLREEMNFAELVHDVRQTLLEAHSNQDLPFEKLVEELQPERIKNRTPIFQVMFVQQNLNITPPSLPGLKISAYDAALSLRANFDLSMAVEENQNGLRVTLTYDAELYTTATIEQMLGHYEQLLKEIALNPYQPIRQLPLLRSADLERLAAWNSTSVEYKSVPYIHQCIETQVDQAPDKAALIFEKTVLTYKEMDEQANRLAHRLVKMGCGPEKRVGVCLERSFDMVIALLAILKTGGAYVPFDPAYPKDRLDFMFQDAEVEVLITLSSLLLQKPQITAQVLCLDACRATIEHESSRRLDPVPALSSNSMAYMIYTSGTTGRPKGAINTHEGIRNRLLWMQDYLQLTANDRVLQKTPFTFDVSVWEFFWPLMTGASLVIARPGGHRDPAYLAELIQSENVTTLHFVPSMLESFLGDTNARKCQSLTRVICSGENLNYELQEKFFSLLSARLYNLYGPTEASVDVTYHLCERGVDRHCVPIGRPIANTQIHVLDAWNQLVPPKIAGELCIGGIGLARGYHGRPDLTAEKFVPDPFSSVPGARLYRTGDLVHRFQDGAIEWLGRLDHQVKLRGFRIELGEIEAALRKQPSIESALVMLREDMAGDKKLVAYVVERKNPGEKADISSLGTKLRESLPEYMVPSAFVQLETFPLSPNGKIDRKALPAPENRRSATVAYTAPQTPMEEKLVEIWETLLGVKPVGIYDNFFELGGHSLLLTALVTRLREVFEVDLSLRILYDTPTVFETATAIAIEQAKRSGLEEAEGWMEEVKNLSPEEVKALLASEQSI